MLHKIKKILFQRQLFIQISLTASIAVLVVALVVSFFVVKLSENVYQQSYDKFNEKILGQIKNEYYQLHVDTVNVLSAAQSSKSLQEYFTKDELSSVEESSIIYKMQEQLQNYGTLHQGIASNVLLVGFNGKLFYPRTAALVDDADQILNNDTVQDALSTPDIIKYYYLKDGFSTNLKNIGGVVAAIKVLKDYQSGEPYGIAIVMMRDNEFSSLYEELIDDNINTIYCVDESGEVISSNDKKSLGNQNDKVNNLQTDQKVDNYSIVNMDLSFMGMRLYSFIDTRVVKSEVNYLTPVLMFTIVLTSIAVTILLLLIKRYFKPLNTIREHIPAITQGDFDNKIDVQSSGEVMELANAFNFMMQGLNEYVENIVRLEGEKKLSEIYALQMQINPHFVYNTLTSIKFLMWQKNTDKAIEAIDAFILLLQCTLGKSEEITTVKDEIENLKNYVIIQNIRYNDSVNVSYHIPEEYEDLVILKMLLQPFVENSFFHAFNQQEEGSSINIFVRTANEQLLIEIIDNGTGMSEDEVANLFSLSSKKEKGFSGLGINNVHNRIRLLYGEDYGVEVSSLKGQGTIIIIKLPILKKNT